MPGTRYSSSFDRICVEDSVPQYRPMHFGMESWQEASLPGNLPLNGSYKHYSRSGSTDSLDSSGTGTTSTSSDCGAGHSQQIPMESTRTVIKTPMVSHNPWQFVKMEPVPLYKKAVDQVKVCQETKLTQDYKKEEEEQWQKKLDSWKSRRKKVTEKTIQRVEDLKLLEKDENQRKCKTRTFSEMVENRAQKPRCYNLSIHGDKERSHLSTVNSYETNDRSHENSSCVFNTSHKNKPSEEENNLRNQGLVQSTYPCNTINNLKDKFEILEEEEDPNDNPKEDSAICMEEDCESCGRYNVDLGLEGFNCSQLPGEIEGISSELSLDDSGYCAKPFYEYELNGNSSVKPEENSGSNSENKLTHPLQDKQQTDSNVHLSMRLRLNSETEDTDFGFTIREENGSYLVDELKYNGVGMQSGLRLNDRIMAINEKNTSGRSRNSILFSLKLSVYNGYLDLLISRSQEKGSDKKEKGVNDSVSEKKYCCSIFSQDAIKCNHQNEEVFGNILDNNGLNSILQSSLLREEEQEPRITRETTTTSAPSSLAKHKLSVGTSFVVGTPASENELDKSYSVERRKFSSPTSVSNLSEEVNHREEKIPTSLSPVLRDLCVQSHSDRLSDFHDTQEKENQKQPSKSEKLLRTPRTVDNASNENGLMIIFHSNSLHNLKELHSNGLHNEPVFNTVSEKKIENDLLKSQRLLENVTHLDFSRDNESNDIMPPALCQIEENSSEGSSFALPEDVESGMMDNRQEMEKFNETKSDLIRQLSGMDSTDAQTSNGEQKLLVTNTQDILAKTDSNEHKFTESVQYEQSQAEEIAEDSFLGEISTLKEKEKLFKEREESLSKRKKEIETELKILLWEEYKLQKEKEEYRRQISLHANKRSTGRIKPCQV